MKPEFKQGVHVLATRPQLRYNPRPARTKCKSESDEASPARTSRLKPVTKESEIKTERVEQMQDPMAEEMNFMKKLLAFHHENKTDIPKSFWFALKKVNLLAVYERVQKLGGYYVCTEKQVWKYLFGPKSTSYNLITRKKYERALLPYENYLKKYKNPGTEDGGNTVRVLKLELEDKDFMNIKKECLLEANDGREMCNDTKSDRLTVAEMSEIQRKVKEKDHDQSPVSVPVTVILGGQSVECHTSTPQNINIQQPHTTITVHQTTIHPQSINLPSNQCQNRSQNQQITNQIQIHNQIQIQQITVQPNSGRNGETGQYTCNIKQDKNGQEVQIESNGDPSKILKRQSSVEEFSGRDGNGYIAHSKIGAGKTSSLRHVRVKQDRSRDRSKPIAVSQPGAQPNEKENIPYLTGSKTTTITPILGNSNKDPRIQSPEVIDLVDSDNESSSPAPQASSQGQLPSTIFPNMKKRKLEILREGGLEVTAISNTGGLLGPNYFGPPATLPAAGDEKSTLRPEIVGSIPSVSGAISPIGCAKAPTPKFQSNCMYTGTSTCKVFGDPKDLIPLPRNAATGEVIDLTVQRLERRKSVEIFRLPAKPANQSATESDSKGKSDSSLQITLVPPLTHVQIIHNSQNHNIKRKASETPNYNSTPPKKSAPETNRSTPSTPSPSSSSSNNNNNNNNRPNIPSFPTSDMKINPFILQHLMSQLPQTRTKPSASATTSQQHQSPRSSQKQSQPKNQQSPSQQMQSHHLHQQQQQQQQSPQQQQTQQSQQQQQQQQMPNPFLPMLDPLYLTALYANPSLFFQPSNFPPELLQLYKNFPLEMGKVPVSKS